MSEIRSAAAGLKKSPDAASLTASSSRSQIKGPIVRDC